jgi:lipopolysaccharide biosynthesis protein
LFYMNSGEKDAATIRAIAFHLPQFHPIPENDEWWGKGFTEWTNVAKAKPLFPGHYQPHLPADLGFYDLRLPEARAAQAQLASEYGVHGFCYYHYWFNGRRVLERPVNDIWKSGEPDFPFCLCWANENWTRQWDGSGEHVLLEQRYSPEDDLAHIQALLPLFSDERYIRILEKPIFLIYRASLLPDTRQTTALWRREAERAGLKGLFLVKVESFSDSSGDPRDAGFDCSLEFQPRGALLSRGKPLPGRNWLTRWKPAQARREDTENKLFDYRELVTNSLAAELPTYPRIPCVCPSWDNTPRRKQGAHIFVNSTPKLYEEWLGGVVRKLVKAPPSGEPAEDLVFINAWNEWGEGNHLEPCQRWGRGYLEATKRALGIVVNRKVEYATR